MYHIPIFPPVAPFEIVGGVPARRIRFRFESDVTTKLLASAWWNWDRATLERRFAELLDVDRFIHEM